MNVERLLQHAARELREVPIEVPTLRGRIRRPASRFVPALAMPVLFMAGGLLATGAGQGIEHPTHSDVDAVIHSTPNTSPEPVEPAGTSGPGSADTAPSIDFELEMLEQRANDSQSAPPTGKSRVGGATVVTRAGPV